MDRRTIAVSGMACGGCESTVESALGELDGVSRVVASHETDSVDVVVEDDLEAATISAAIRDAGYEVEG